MLSGEGSYSAVGMESSSGSSVLLVLTKDILAACAHAWNIAGAQEKGPEALPFLSGEDILAARSDILAVFFTAGAVPLANYSEMETGWDVEYLGHFPRMGSMSVALLQ